MNIKRFKQLLESRLGNVRPLLTEAPTPDMGSDMGTKPVSSIESKKQKIINYQLKLKKAGCDLGTSGPNKDGIDGVWGPKTKKAYYEFKKFGKCSVNQKDNKTTTQQDKTKNQSYKYSPRIDKELEFIKSRDAISNYWVTKGIPRDKTKSFFIYDPKYNLIYLFGSNYEYLVHTSVVDGADAQKDAKPFTIEDWCKASNMDITPYRCTDKKTKKPAQPIYKALIKLKSRFFPKGIYSITQLTSYKGYTGKGNNMFRLRDEEGTFIPNAIHGIPNLPERLTASSELEKILNSDINSGKVPEKYLDSIKKIAKANQSYGCIGVPASFVENPIVIKNVTRGTNLFVIGEGNKDYLVQNSDEYFEKLGSDGENCDNPEALAKNIGSESSNLDDQTNSYIA